MTQEDKELLLQDLCTRLPYGVKVQVFNYGIETVEKLYQIDLDGYISTIEGNELKYSYKPYLFPLSSMTEEQKNQLEEIWNKDMDKALDYSILGEDELCDLCQLSATKNVIDWLNANYFDYRGLIPKGLAINATGLNVY